MERGGDGGHGGVQNGGIERFHEEGNRDEPREEFFAGGFEGGGS